MREQVSTIDKSAQVVVVQKDLKSTMTTIPFVKDNEFDYSDLLSWLGDTAQDWAG